MENRNTRSLFSLKDKNGYKDRVLPIKEIVLVSYAISVKPNVMQKLDGMNINPTKSSKLSEYLGSNANHYFTWAVISNSPKNAKN